MTRHRPSRGGRRPVPLAALALGLLAVCGLPAAQAHAEPTQTGHPSAAQVLASLDAQQRAALGRLGSTGTTGLHFEDADALTSAKPVAVIVQFRQPTAHTARLLAAVQGQSLSEDAARESVERAHSAFASGLARQYPTGGYRVGRSFSQSFDGVSMTLPGDQVPGLLQIAGVAAVWPDSTVHALDDSTAGTAGTADTSGQDAIAAGIRRLHDEGVTGAGVKVGVIDTGIDYRHPDLKDAYAGGYDFVDGDTDPMETTYADWQASGLARTRNGEPYWTEHGTHVAGILAGRGADDTALAAHGVAPGAKVYAYRVLGPYGSGTSANVLAGMERAMTDGMDVVSMSLGSSVNDPLDPESVAADNLVLAGVTTVIAAGNSGSGSYTLGSPGSAALPITVGANDTPLQLPSYTLGFGSSSVEVRLLAQPYGDGLTPLGQGSYGVVDVGTGTAAGYSGKIVTGKAVLIHRGGITLNEKVTRARTLGAAAVLLANDNAAEGQIPYYLGESNGFVPAFSMTAADGTALGAALSAGVTVTFSPRGLFTLGGGGIASFSSRGPSYGTDTVKPEVTAPGVDVLSSVPADVVDPTGDPTGDDYTYAYARLSGTSMATPYVAGAAALLLQHDPSLSPDAVKAALMNTARPLEGPTSVFDSGAGEIDPYAAVHATASVTTGATTTLLAVDGTAQDSGYRTAALDYGALPLGSAVTRDRVLEVRNDDGSPARYSVSVSFSRGEGSSQDAAAAGVRLTATDRITVGGHGQGRIATRLSLPASAPAGFYEGTVTLTPEDPSQTVLHLPVGMRVVRTGLDDVRMTKSVLSTNQGTGAGAAAGGQATFDFTMAGQLDSLDVFLDDAEGNDLGFVGRIDTKGLTEGVRYGPVDVEGWYHPMTGDELEPFDARGRWAADGHYKLRVIGTDAAGTQYTQLRDVYVDTKAPAYTDAYGPADPAHPTVVERPVGQTRFTISGTLLDGEADAIGAAGIAVGQDDNTVQYSTSSLIAPDHHLSADASGHIEGQVSLQAGPPVGFVKLWPMDAAGNLADTRLINVIDAGRPYVVGDASTSAARPGDTVSYTLTAHELTQWKSFSTQIRYDAANVRILSVEPTAELQQYGPSAVTVAASGSGSMAYATASFDVSAAAGITGDSVPLLKVTYRVLDGGWSSSAGLSTGSTSATQVGGATVGLNTQYYGSVQKLNPLSSFGSRPAAQALLTPGSSFDAKHDYSADGERVTLTAPDGTVRSLEPDASGRVGVGGLDPSDAPYRLTVSVPGHFTWHSSVDLALHGSWGLAGAVANAQAELVAGDVNGDDVIDVRDAAAVYAARGTADRAADVDHDGVVDGADLAWVARNYLAQNTTADQLTEPQLSYHGKDLADFVALMR